MQGNIKMRFFRAAKGKVIIGFLLACLALFSAWGISKFAFKKMVATVEEISTPNDRLRVVNQLSHSILRLDQLQRDRAINNQSKNAEFLKESKILRKSLDTLSKLYVNDKTQLQRIQAIKKLLADRDRQFIMYLRVRENLVNTKSFSQEVNKLSGLISQRNTQTDSSVVTQTSTSTTTLAPQTEESRGFLNKLFGKKRAEVYKIISEEYQVKRDTINPEAEDSIINNIESALKSIEFEQKQKSAKFLKREANLANASVLITRQMLNILREVEAEAVTQVDRNSAQAKQIINKGIDQISWLLIGFFLLTTILAYLILADITNINRYRKALENTKDEAEYHSKAKQRFLSNMSHEIRTPLQSILGYAELIAQQPQPDKKHVNAIYRSSVHLLQIVNEVLDYNRIISGEFSFNNQVFSLVKVLDEVVAVMRPLAEKKSVALITDFDLDGIEYVDGDAFRLKQILFNLLGNAVKFTIKGSITLALSLKKHEAFVHLNFSIKDTGIGFEEDNIRTIFNEFEQVESKEKYLLNQTGAGLGLAIVKSLVEGQDGRINVKSKKDRGTTFTVHLKYPFALQPTNDAIQTNRSAGVNPDKVWVVDDDNLILELCSLIFENNQIPYCSFNNATAILEAEIDTDVRKVLIDMRLPEMSGMELHRILKRKMPTDVKFYAMTAQVLPDEQQAVLQGGFTGLIIKPFRTEDILSIFEKSVAPKEEIAFDLSAIEKMTMGDQALLKRILTQFNKDCSVDIAELNDSLSKDNQAITRLLTHRLAGRIAQVGATTLAADFRKVELYVAEIWDNNVKNEINELIMQLKDLLIEIENISYTMP